MLSCCNKLIELHEYDFTADGKLIFHCEKHNDGVYTSYLTWRGGLTKTEMEARQKKDDKK